MARRKSRDSAKDDGGDDTKTRLPNTNQVDKLLGLSVKAADGSSVSFKSIIDDPSHPRVLTVFIRHFFCGFCEQYVSALSAALPPAHLSDLSPPTKLVVIGCGAPSLISDYAARTNCAFDIFADPDRTTYDALGFAVTLTVSNGQAPEYASAGFLSTVWSSFVTNLSAGTRMLQGGKTAQQGGEVCWRNGEVQWINRMGSSIDHLDVPMLKERLA